jgi:hypothetical protein
VTRVSEKAEQALEDSSKGWGITPRVAAVLFLLPLVGGLGVVGTRVSRSLFHHITDEDAILEWGQVVLYVTAGAFAFVTALRLWRSGSRVPALAWLALTLGCVFVTGEEVSWGQRIFHWATPESLRAINRQGETNLHNIRSVLNGVNAVLLVGGLYGAVGWSVLKRLRAKGRSLDRAWLFVPPFFLSSTFAVVFAYKLSRFTVFHSSRYTIVRLGEWAELCFGFGLAAFAVLVYNRLRREEEVGRRRVLTEARASLPPGSTARAPR